MKKQLVEKYRPTKISEIVGNKDIIVLLENIIATKNFPHLLFHGKSGCGKTTAAWCIARANESVVLELNASDERGIDTVRTKIIGFAHRSENNKLIILDECDSMTAASQQALRRVMETSGNKCKFILVCNDIMKITEAIQSRCAVVVFQPPSEKEVKDCVATICQKEKMLYDDSGIEYLCSLGSSDLRKTINMLQSVAVAFGNVTEENVSRIIETPSPAKAREILAHIELGEFTAAYDKLDQMFQTGHSAEDVCKTFHSVVLQRSSSEKTKCAAIQELASLHLRISKGHTSSLQFYRTIYMISLVL